MHGASIHPLTDDRGPPALFFCDQPIETLPLFFVRGPGQKVPKMLNVRAANELDILCFDHGSLRGLIVVIAAAVALRQKTPCREIAAQFATLSVRWPA